MTNDWEFRSLLRAFSDDPTQVHCGSDGVESGNELASFGRCEVIQDPTRCHHGMPVLARSPDEGRDVGNRISSFDRDAVLARDLHRSDEAIETFDLFGPYACSKPLDMVLVEQVDWSGIESCRPDDVRNTLEQGRVSTRSALYRKVFATADEFSGSDVVADFGEQQRQSCAAADIDTGDVPNLILDHCEWKEEPIATSDLVGLRRSRCQEGGEIVLVVEDEANECVRDVVIHGLADSRSSEIRVVVCEFLIRLAQKQKVDTSEE